MQKLPENWGKERAPKSWDAARAAAQGKLEEEKDSAAQVPSEAHGAKPPEKCVFTGDMRKEKVDMARSETDSGLVVAAGAVRNGVKSVGEKVSGSAKSAMSKSKDGIAEVRREGKNLDQSPEKPSATPKKSHKKKIILIAAAAVLALACAAAALFLLKEQPEDGSAMHASDVTAAPSESASAPPTESERATESTETTAPTESANPETTEQPTEKSAPAETLAVRNGYVICPNCNLICTAGESCRYCAGIGELGSRCAGCGGYSGKTDASHFTCWYCDAVYCPLVNAGYVYETVHCSDCGECEFVPSGKPHHCSVCGVCYLKASINSEGLCATCAALPRCMICGHVGYDVYEGYCDACSVKLYCSLCGADITYRGGISVGDGTVVYCEDCWETVYWEQPNVTCPHCGYAFFASGVGVDGLDCPQCGKNFMP